MNARPRTTGSLTAALPEKLTDEQAEELRAVLTRHYHCRVAPVHETCEALQAWARVMAESGYAPEIGEWMPRVMFLLSKSNLAARLVYGGEPVRTEKCPEHKGHWSGCRWPDTASDVCQCSTGSNVTGWLPTDERYSDRAYALANWNKEGVDV